MRIKLIACKSLFRELSYLSALSDNAVDITWIRQGFHDTPERLRELLQEEIDSVEAGTDLHTNHMNAAGTQSGIADDFDAIVLGYGLCSNAIIGLKAASHRLVIPRAHDCVTLFLGSKEKYADCFEKLPGCFWYSAGWMENTDMPSEVRDRRIRNYFQSEDYDEETIAYLMEEMGGLKNYSHLAYIPMPFIDKEKYRRQCMDTAQYYGWDYHEIPGDLTLLEALIRGDWDSERFLILEPGQTAAQSYDSRILCAK